MKTLENGGGRGGRTWRNSKDISCGGVEGFLTKGNSSGAKKKKSGRGEEDLLIVAPIETDRRIEREVSLTMLG